jgi:cell division protein FtsI/penicillin-binding protein 2
MSGTERQVMLAQARRVRVWSVAWIVLVAVALLGTTVQVVLLKTAPDPRLEAAAGTQRSEAREPARRGQIVDRRGRVLATSLMARRAFADPALIWERGWERLREKGVRTTDRDPFVEAAEVVGNALGVPPVAIDRVLREHADNRYVVIWPELTEAQAADLRSIHLAGVGVETFPQRVYPADEVGSQVIGRVGTEQKGQSGAELQHEVALAGMDGSLGFLRDVRRRPLWIDERDHRPSRHGHDVRLALDLVVQEIAERQLDAAVSRYNAGGGRAVVMDVETGDILAIADVLRSRRGWQEITTDPQRRIHASLGRNRNVTDPYEPGSTFKPFVWAVATEQGIFRPGSTVSLPNGPYRTRFGRMIRDVKYTGPVSWKTVLVKSLNGGMAAAAERMSFSQMQSVLERFGFGRRTAVGIPGESEGLLTSPKDWSKYTQTSVCMGHELGVTPVQMVQAFSAFCRDGTMVPARLTLGEEGAERDYPPPSRRVISEAVALAAREAMEGVLTEGTGRKAQSEQYRMFGKSGTAQLPRPKGQGKGYFEDRYVSSFIAGAPFEHPRIVCLVVIDDPDKARGHFGGSVAGPVCRDIVDETLEYMGVAPDQPAQRREQVAALREDTERH